MLDRHYRICLSQLSRILISGSACENTKFNMYSVIQNLGTCAMFCFNAKEQVSSMNYKMHRKELRNELSSSCERNSSRILYRYKSNNLLQHERKSTHQRWDRLAFFPNRIDRDRKNF